jgi:hypothetical protein
MNRLPASVALKIMPPSSMESAQHEVAVHAALDHGHARRDYVIRLVEGFVVRGFPCIAFEVHGTELARHVRKERPLSFPETRALGRQMLEALAALHSAGFVHGDVKPGNILWDPSLREGRLIDLGWARTRYPKGSAIATRDYSPPEMLLGLEMTSAVDMWGLACTLFEAFTGEPFFDPIKTCREKYVEFASYQSPPDSGEGEETDDEVAFALALKEGMLFDGRFRLQSVLGSGKSGNVWLAHTEESLGSVPVLLKPAELPLENQEEAGMGIVARSDLNIYEVVIGYEHFLCMQSYAGEYPGELAKAGSYHDIFFDEDGSFRFNPRIERISLASRIAEGGRCDAGTASAMEALLMPMLAMDAARRPSAREMLEMARW